MFETLNFFDTALLMYDSLRNNEPKCIGKIGSAELFCLYNYHSCLHKRIMPIDWNPIVEKEIFYNAGVFPQNEEARVIFCKKIENAVQNTDIMVSWNSAINDFEKRFIKSRNSKCKLVDLMGLEPYYFGLPWTHLLENRNVLVISPFSETIKKQYEKKDLIWTNKLLPNFNLHTIYHPTSKGISNEKQNPYASWEIMVNDICEKMDNIDFDVAIIGTGASSLILASHAKKLGKIGIHLGGALQILFGIKGKRWEESNFLKNVYNKSWVRPSLDETPEKCNKIEGGCYW